MIALLFPKEGQWEREESERNTFHFDIYLSLERAMAMSCLLSGIIFGIFYFK